MQVLRQTVEAGAAAGISTTKSTPLVAAYIDHILKQPRALAAVRGSQLKVRKPKKSKADECAERIARLIKAERVAINKLLVAIPSGLSKAITALEHTCTTDPNAEALTVIGPLEKPRFKTSVAELRRRLLEPDMENFPSHREREGYTALMRYYEDFEPADAKPFLRAFSEQFAAELDPNAIPMRDQSTMLPFEMAPTLQNFWMFARCRHLRYRLAPGAARLTGHLESWQAPSGAWQRYVSTGQNRNAETRDDATVTALAMLFLLRYGEPADHKKSLEKARRWLLQHPNPHGGWVSAWRPRGDFDTFATALVLDALRRTGTPLDHPVIARAEQFLIDTQDPIGFWLDQHISHEHLTGVVVEYLKARTLRGGDLPNVFLISGKTLIDRSQNLALSEVKADARLAVIAAYHGLEHVLYGWMLYGSDDSSQSEIYRGGGSQTAGFREALTLFEALAKRKQWLPSSGGLPFKTQLSHLATTRDHVVHQGTSVQPEDAEKHVGFVRSFVRRFDEAVLGFPLLD